MSTIGIITARGGSKGIKNKNLIPLGGTPLIGHTIQAALESQLFDVVVVTSDSEAILEYAQTCGALALKRPEALAQDMTPTEPVITHCIEHFAALGQTFDCAILLQPTSPLRQAKHIIDAKTLYDTQPCNMVVSVVEPSSHPMKAYTLNDEGNLAGAFGPQHPYSPRQSLPTCYYANGAIYAFNVADYMSRQGFAKEQVKPYIMSAKDSTDIDSLEDLAQAERLLSMS